MKRQMKSSAKLSNIFVVHWLPAPNGLKLALLEDNPALTDDMYSGYLSFSEKVREKLKTSPSVRRNWLLGRLATKIAAESLWPESEMEVVRGPQGRPLFGFGRRVGRHVSISHTGGAALAAVGEIPVGVDLERAERFLSQRVLGFAFSPAELELIPGGGGFIGPGDSPDSGDSSGRANFPWALALWCAREAAAKSRGLGLLNHLRQVRVTGADWPAGQLTVDWVGEGEPWRAKVFLQITGPWLTALAVGEDCD